MLKRLTALILIFIFILSFTTAVCALEPPFSFSEAYMCSDYYTKLINVELTGVQRSDLVNTALSQLGYHEGWIGDYSGSDISSNGNCTEYNRCYYGWDAAGEGYAWCAVFLSWCARAAGISRNIIHNHNRANATAFGLSVYYFGSRNPLPGDAAFVNTNEYRDADHVAIVYRTDENYIYTVEGNAADAVRLRRYRTCDGRMVDEDDVPSDLVYILFYGVPWYYTGTEGGPVCKEHIYTKGCEDSCAVCGVKAETSFEKAELVLAATGYEVSIYSTPYAKSTAVLKTVPESEHLHANASAVNTLGEVWYRLEEGGFVKADDVCYVYSPDELLPVITEIENGPERYSLLIESADENVSMSIETDGSEPKKSDCSLPSGTILSSDRPFFVRVKAFHKGVESETISFVFAEAENISSSQEPVTGMAAFSDKKTYLGLFSDVPEKSWYYLNVRKAYELGLMNGYEATLFGIDGIVTEAQTVAVAARMHSLYHNGTADFVCEDGEVWTEPYIVYALENGLISEAPSYIDRAVTRSEFVSVISRAIPAEELAEIVPIEDGSIPDAIGDENYVNWIYALYRAGILRGSGDISFRGELPIGRAEAAAIMTRLACPELRSA